MCVSDFKRQSLLRSGLLYGILAAAVSPLLGGEPPPPTPVIRSGPSKSTVGDLLGLGSAGQTAADLRRSAEILEQLSPLIRELTPIVAETVKATSGHIADMTGHLAEMSSGFDPFGYQAAFETINRQNEIIFKQQELIQKLQSEEIARLKQELQDLRAPKSEAKKSAEPPRKPRKKPGAKPPAKPTQKPAEIS